MIYEGLELENMADLGIGLDELLSKIHRYNGKIQYIIEIYLDDINQICYNIVEDTQERHIIESGEL